MKERTKDHTFQPKLFKSKVNPNKDLNYQVYQKKLIMPKLEEDSRQDNLPPKQKSRNNSPQVERRKKWNDNPGKALENNEQQYV